MKKILVLSFTLTTLLSACIGPPKVDFANIDSICAQQCSANHTSCMSGFKLFLLANESSCKTAMETCAQTCPPKSAVSVAQPKVPVSNTERLKELDSLYRGGLISKDEYDVKRQEVLKSM